MRDTAYRWWKQKHGLLRKPLVFALGLVLISSAPLVGFIPGPGGILIFLAGIAILGSEFDWALALKAFFLKTVPKEVKKRWRPTPRWEFVFDITSMFLISASLVFLAYQLWSPFLSSLAGGFTLLIFNRNRLDKINLLLKRPKK